MILGEMGRASDNSLRIKGIAMLLFAGTIAFLLRDGESASAISLPLSIVLLLTIFILGLLDAYFVRQVDLLKIMYNLVRMQSEDDVDFSMELEQHSMELRKQYNENPPIPIVTTISFYACVFLTVIIAALP